jgi:mono/diheme cytochrome c family protein
MSARPIVIALLAGTVLSGCGGHVNHHGKSTLTNLGGSVASRGGLFDDGRSIFVRAGCGACHTVASAHTSGQIGPDFDTSEQLNRSQILTEIDAGANGMPSFQDRLTPRQKRAVIEFIFQTMHTRR